MGTKHDLFYTYSDMLASEKRNLRAYVHISNKERAQDLARRRRFDTSTSSRARLVIATKLLIARYVMRMKEFDQTIDYFK
ncbi:hypothetical protein HOT95_gp031 [Vibrio phage vB_VpS_PG07]|uniref:Uncharacterized protein n=1 Tax=Vibrio phage vB_VpS_PG07 TaxID=2301664 RepID=A0A385E4H6_9CAUD|nr:hypothetical protein HOT95_gp031 [Vibrio phage vB_VpS_PG07]AXQ66656.1 hypothetical protein [Vibrio phage vB_VpS_PG07]